ncbi:hypothetical protein GCM10009828_019480 [Actinoplanes couchii]|uniref:Uncharacterized protein n=1 Tax=Actinoplanes couchii TaxID=403638 RepID=A0ABQ3XDN3_9ACTN|nr:hypothetical protein Aco03nite_050210 [Actinoplanes couchii]
MGPGHARHAAAARPAADPVLTRTWTENPDKGRFDYRTYDPGTGDFLGVDCYVPAGTRRWVMSPARRSR